MGPWPPSPGRSPSRSFRSSIATSGPTARRTRPSSGCGASARSTGREINDYPEEEGLWSVTKAEDVREVSLDWETFSSERGGVTGLTHQVPLELAQAMFIGMDPPKHDRIKMLFQRGFTPKRIAEHEDEIRAIAERVLDGVADRGGCDLVTDVAQPVVSRVIGSFMGIPEEDDAPGRP